MGASFFGCDAHPSTDPAPTSDTSRAPRARRSPAPRRSAWTRVIFRQYAHAAPRLEGPARAAPYRFPGRRADTLKTMDKASGPRRRRIGRIVAAVVGGLAALLTLLPLVLRGPVARWVVRQASSSLCGTIEISGGHLGWAATWALLSGRPFDLVLENVKIDGPNGTTVFAAARFETTLEMHFRPSRVILSRLLMARGRWELALLPNETGLFDAFRSIPEAGRAACLDPNARPKARKQPGIVGPDRHSRRPVRGCRRRSPVPHLGAGAGADERDRLALRRRKRPAAAVRGARRDRRGRRAADRPPRRGLDGARPVRRGQHRPGRGGARGGERPRAGGCLGRYRPRAPLGAGRILEHLSAQGGPAAAGRPGPGRGCPLDRLRRRAAGNGRHLQAAGGLGHASRRRSARLGERSVHGPRGLAANTRGGDPSHRERGARRGRSVDRLRRPRDRLDARSGPAPAAGRPAARTFSRHRAPLADAGRDRGRDPGRRSAARAAARAVRTAPLSVADRQGRRPGRRGGHALRLGRQRPAGRRRAAARRSARRLDRALRAYRRARGVRHARPTFRPGERAARAVARRGTWHPGRRGARGLDPGRRGLRAASPGGDRARGRSTASPSGSRSRRRGRSASSASGSRYRAGSTRC